MMSQPVIRGKVLSDCAVDWAARVELGAHWTALTGQELQIEALPPALHPDDHDQTAAYLGHALYRALVASTEHLGRPPHPVSFMTNGAPRDGAYPNGVPFCFFEYGPHQIIAPYNAVALRMVRRYLGVAHVQVTDVETVLRAAMAWGEELTEDDIRFITGQKFRSLWYELRLAVWLHEERPVPAETRPIPIVPGDDEPVLSYYDGFGNAFLGLTGAEAGLRPGDKVVIPRFAEDGLPHEMAKVPCYAELTDVPLGEPGLVVGEDGESFMSCGSAAEHFRLPAGKAVSLG
jgi:hypothetical protein